MARPASVFATIPDDRQHEALTRLWKEHRNHYTRLRAQAVLLSARRYEVARIVDILGVSDEAVRSWIARFGNGRGHRERAGTQHSDCAARPPGSLLVIGHKSQV